MAEAPPGWQSAPRFEASRRATSRSRRLGYLIGSAVWVAALIVLAFVLDQTDAVEAALAIVVVSVVLGICVSGMMRRGRIRGYLSVSFRSSRPFCGSGGGLSPASRTSLPNPSGNMGSGPA